MSDIHNVSIGNGLSQPYAGPHPKVTDFVVIDGASDLQSGQESRAHEDSEIDVIPIVLVDF